MLLPRFMIFSNPSRRFALAAGLLALTLLAVPGGALAEGDPGRKPRIALVMKSLANEFFQTMESGAKEHQAANPDEYELLANGIRNETDTAAQIGILEQMIAARVDAIVLAPADSKALVPAVKRAVDAGIIVINIDNRLDAGALEEKGLSVPFVGPDNRAGARKVGEHVAKFLQAGDEVGIIEGVSTTFNAQQRTLGFRDAMAAAKAEVVGVQSGEWEIGKANAVAAAMLSEYPRLKALLAGNDSMALGAVAAVRSAGRAGKVIVAGYDNISAIAPMLRDGRVLATADQHAARQAIFGIETALAALAAGKKQADLQSVVETPVDLIVE